MTELFESGLDLLRRYIVQEWFVAFVAVIVTMVIFLVQQKTGNRLSRYDFIYRISSDFSSNERILKVYDWIEKCRRENRNKNNYRSLTTSGKESIFSQEINLDYVDVDSYINHFESVYVILAAVKMETVDELFQQRFFTFMHNPYIQREEFFECFTSNKNDFMLYRKWVRSAYRRKGFDSFSLAEYLSKYTCGSFEYRLDREAYARLSLPGKLVRRRKQCRFMFNYIWYICDPKCRYGYYRLERTNGETGEPETKTVRIIRSYPDDLEDIIALQSKVSSEMEIPEWFARSDRDELRRAVSDKSCIALQADCGSDIAAFAYIILEPDEKYSLGSFSGDAAVPRGAESVIDSVFVSGDYRGFGLQSLLIDILCRLARSRRMTSVWATVHPDNRFSAANFEKNGFIRTTEKPIARYGGERHIYFRNISRLGLTDKSSGEYCVYPEF